MIGYGTAAATKVTGVKTGDKYDYTFQITGTVYWPTTFTVTITIDNVTDSAAHNAQVGYTENSTNTTIIPLEYETELIRWNDASANANSGVLINKNIVNHVPSFNSMKHT